MKFDRRNFIRSASLLAAFSLTELEALTARNRLKHDNLDIDPGDEAYWRSVRQLFPLTEEKIYLNNGTMGPSPFPVVEAIHKGMAYADETGNYGGYEKSIEKIAGFVKADKDEIALTHNVTEGINIAAWGFPLRKKDEVIMTTHEHAGNAYPWLNRQKLDGIVIKTFAPAKTAEETLNRIAALINKRTKVIAVPHIPCTQGQVLPVKEICQLAKDKGLFSFIDGAHGPGMLPLDLHDMGCDVYASCCHKWMLGPKGTGFLYVRKDMLDTIQPYFVGAGSVAKGWEMVPEPVTEGGYVLSAHRYFGGTQSTGHAYGVTASIEFIESIGMHNIYKRVKSLGDYTQQRLLEFGNNVHLLTPVEDRSHCAITSFRIKGVNYKDFAKTCGEAKVRIRQVPENGLNCLRVSTHIYNNKEEIDVLADLVKRSLA